MSDENSIIVTGQPIVSGQAHKSYGQLLWDEATSLTWDAAALASAYGAAVLQAFAMDGTVGAAREEASKVSGRFGYLLAIPAIAADALTSAQSAEEAHQSVKDALVKALGADIAGYVAGVLASQAVTNAPLVAGLVAAPIAEVALSFSVAAIVGLAVEKIVAAGIAYAQQNNSLDTTTPDGYRVYTDDGGDSWKVQLSSGTYVMRGVAGGGATISNGSIILKVSHDGDLISLESQSSGALLSFLPDVAGATFNDGSGAILRSTFDAPSSISALSATQTKTNPDGSFSVISSSLDGTSINELDYDNSGNQVKGYSKQLFPDGSNNIKARRISEQYTDGVLVQRQIFVQTSDDKRSIEIDSFDDGDSWNRAGS